MSLNRSSRGVTDRIVLICGAISAGIGVLFLVRWAIGWDVFTIMRTRYIPMAPSTALLSVLLGSAMLVREVWPASRSVHHATVAAAFFTAVLGSVPLIGFAIGLNIDDSLFRYTRMFGEVPIGGVPPVTAFCFVLASVSLLLLEWQARTWAAILGILTTLAGAVCLMGYWFGAPLFYSGTVSPVALPTSLALVALGVGLTAAAGPDTWPLNALIGPSARARLLRVLLPTVVILTLVSDWITAIVLEHSDPGVVLASTITAISFLLVVGLVVSRVSRTIGDAIDRTQAERKRAEETRARLAAIVENSSDPIIGRAVDGTVTSWNAAAERILGYTAAEAIGHKLIEIQPPELRQEAAERRKLILAGRPVRNVETVRIAKDGRRLDVEASIFAIKDGSGRIISTASLLRDITERKQRKDRLFLLNQRLHQLVETIPKLALARDLESIVGVACSAARSLIGSDGSTFVLRDGDQCFYADEDAIRPLWKGQRFPMSTCISGWVMLNHQPAVIKDIYADPRIPASAYRPTFVKSLAMVPIRSRDPLAAIGNYWAHSHLPTPEEVQLLQTLADATAIVMENVRLFDDQEQRLVELKQVTNTLRESEERYRDLVENSQDLICTHDLEGKLLSVNEAAIRLTGYSREALLCMNIADLLVPAVRDSCAAYLTEIRTAGVAHGVMCIQTAGGESRIWEYNNTLQTGAVPMVRGMAQDVTERMRAEKELRETEERFRSLTEMSSDFYWESDVEHRVTTRRTTGKSGTALVGERDMYIGKRRWEMRYLSPDETGWQAHRAVLDAHLPFRNFEYSCLDGNGAERHISVSGEPIFGASGAFRGYRGVSIEITERKESESQLRKSEQRYRQIIRTSMDGFWVADTEARILDVNDTYCQLIGYSRDELLTMGVPDVEAKERPEETACHMQEAMTKGGARFETRHRRKDGQVLEIEISAVYQLDQGEGRFFAFLRDITERKRAEKALRAAMFALTLAEEHERRTIAADLHDFPGQLLAAANLKLSGLPRETDRTMIENTIQEAREMIEQAQRSLRSLIFQVSPPVLFELGLVPALLWLAEEMHRNFGIAVNVHDDGNSKALDQTLRTVVFRVVRELVINVAKHAKIETAYVDVRCGDGHLIVSVTDYGVGFDPNNIGKTGAEGGFGLVSIRERLGFVGGEIEIDSVPGDGTVATLSVPLSAEAGIRGG